jgi:hypothetical protein
MSASKKVFALTLLGGERKGDTQFLLLPELLH